MTAWGKPHSARDARGDIVNDGNLKRPSSDEARELGRRGGIASGAARRRRKALREALDVYISLPVQDKRSLNRLLRVGVDEDDADTQMLIISSLVQRAIDGNVRAAKLIFDLVGYDSAQTLDEREDDPITAALNEEFGSGTF